jgi:hypothetical protein
MSRKSYPALFVLVLVAVGLLSATPAMADAQTPPKPHAAQGSARGVAPHTCYPVAGHFASRWYQDSNRYGCATSPEYPYLNGTYQEFVNGEMDWSPSQGANMVLSGTRYGYWDDWGFHTGITFQFGQSDPFNYDSWLIRLDRNGVNLGQWECGPGVTVISTCGRTGGFFGWAPVGPGHYRIIIEGCDVGGGGHTCRQGWTIPVDLAI